ncbi:MAG: HAD-IIIA family hydrolase [Candidatus Aenigmarchaeota archaeon]
MQAVILAGGKGTRTGNKEIPKVMAEVGDRTILQHQIELLKRYGITDIILCVKHLSEKIKKHFGDGKKFGVRITYSEEREFLGTAGAVKFAEKMIKEEFILFYGDVMMNMHLAKFIEYHKNKKGIATLLVHRTDHPHDSDIVDMDSENRIRKIWRPKPGENFRNLSNAAVYVLSSEIFKYVPKNKFLELEKDVLVKMIEKNLPLYGYKSEEYVKDTGTPERLEGVREDYENGRIFRPAVFLDRDGVINEEINLLCKPSQLKPIEGSAEGIRMLNENGFLVIVVTNQPVVARNLCTEEDLVIIHGRLKELLAERGAKLDAIYYCPHHPDKGYPEENPKYKIDCECRKPKPGMILQASKDFALDPRKCVIVGDRLTDIEIGENVGCKTILVLTGNGRDSKNADAKPDHVCENLLEAAKLIIKTYKPR